MLENEDNNDSQNYKGTGITSTNYGYNLAGVMELRLDTRPILDQIEAFLRGKRLLGYRDGKDGFNEAVWGSIGKARANDEGIQSLLSWLEHSINSQTVQGNFSPEQYDDYICEFEIDLGEYIMINLHNWDININEIDGIINCIMKVTIPFFSRLIDNKERESYGQTMKSIESNTVEKKKGGLFGMFKN